MRKGRREVLSLAMVFLLGILGGAARFDKGKSAIGSDETVALTIEFLWNVTSGGERASFDVEPGTDGSGVTLGVTDGRVSDVIEWRGEERGLRKTGSRRE